MIDTLEEHLRATLKLVAANTVIPPAPISVGAQGHRGRSKKRRLVLGAAAVAAFAAVGVPVAAAAGVLPPAIAASFGWSHRGPITAEEATGRLLLTLPGPNGQPMQLYEAKAVGGGQCVTMFLPEAPKAEQIADASCTSRAGGTPKSVVAGASSASAAGTYMILYGPRAAYLTLSDGITTRRLPVADGLSEAWLPPVDLDRPLTLTGFSSIGATVGQFRFNQRLSPQAVPVRPHSTCNPPTVTVIPGTHEACPSS
ncbi:MAG: hypothetical protein ACYC1D_11570 [Acidimicrobiales bacterium]